jgi:hypothetical protein
MSPEQPYVAMKEVISTAGVSRSTSSTLSSSTGKSATSRTFRIEDASRLVWRWFYYGRSPIPENLHRIEYVRTPDGRVRVVRDRVADLPVELERVLDVDRETPAVEMTSFIAT